MLVIVAFHRLAEMFRYVFIIPISEETLVKAIDSVTKKVVPVYVLISKRAETAKVNGGNETGMRINGHIEWF